MVGSVEIEDYFISFHKSRIKTCLLVKEQTSDSHICPVCALDSIQVGNTLVGNHLPQVNGNYAIIICKVLFYPAFLREIYQMRIILHYIPLSFVNITVHQDARKSFGISNIEFVVSSKICKVQIPHISVTIRNTRRHTQLISTTNSSSCCWGCSTIPAHKHICFQLGNTFLQNQS